MHSSIVTFDCCLIYAFELVIVYKYLRRKCHERETNKSVVIKWQCDMMLALFTGSLQIQRSQESDEGKYECVAENNVGVEYSYGANLYVRGRI
jgi:hypothetical protein